MRPTAWKKVLKASQRKSPIEEAEAEACVLKPRTAVVIVLGVAEGSVRGWSSSVGVLILQAVGLGGELEDEVVLW